MSEEGSLFTGGWLGDKVDSLQSCASTVSSSDGCVHMVEVSIPEMKKFIGAGLTMKR